MVYMVVLDKQGLPDFPALQMPFDAEAPSAFIYYVF